MLYAHTPLPIAAICIAMCTATHLIKKGERKMIKAYVSPDFSVIQSLSEYCKGLSLGLLDDRSGYTQVETEDPFGEE